MGLFDKAKDLAAENSDKIDDAVDQGADLVDEKTGGKYGEQIDQGSEFAKDKAGEFLGSDNNEDQQEGQ